MIRLWIQYFLALHSRVFVKVRRQPSETFFPAVNQAVLVKTTAYVDVMAMQKMLLLVYLPLPMFLAMLISEVCTVTDSHDCVSPLQGDPHHLPRWFLPPPAHKPA